MANYFIDIIDTTTGDLVLIEEFASRSGLTLEWNGNDAKDELFLVGSSLTFDMQAPNLSMGHFLHLFTGDEQKFRVEFRKEQSSELGPELAINPQFNDGTAGWRSVTLSLISNVSNQLRINATSFGNPIVSHKIDTVVGKTYTVSVDVKNALSVSSYSLLVGENAKGFELLHITNILEGTTATGSFTATSTLTEIGVEVFFDGLGGYGLIDNFSLRESLADNPLLWQGFLLPDSYQEPYTTSVPFIQVSATDGLGRLKGKYLPDVFYTKEVSVIEVVQACLSQTGLQMPLFFSAAIQHVTFKKYHTIYIDGTLLINNDKKETCYNILTDLMESMVCMVYQSYGNWYVEGLNVRHLSTVVYDEYNVFGAYIGEVQQQRLIKQVDAKTVVTPIVSMVPVYKTVGVNYTIEPPALPGTVLQLENKGWAAQANDYVYSPAFFPHGGASFAIATGYTEYKVRLNKAYISELDLTRYVSLMDPVYVNIGQEVLVEIDFATTINIPTDNTLLKVEVLLNAVVIFTTTLFYDPTIEEEDEKKLTLLKEVFIISESGYLDVIFYQPISDGNGSAGTDGWEFAKFKISIANQQDEYEVFDQINGEFSLEKQIDLVYVDEFSASNKVLLLEQVDSQFSTSYNHTITVLKEFQADGKNYMQVYLRDAYLCDSFKNNLLIDAVNVLVIDVFYNWLGATNEYVVQLSAPVNSGVVQMELKKGVKEDFDRSSWQQWTDAVYKIENKRYGNAVADVYRRMFLEPYEKIDCTVLHMLTFHDLVLFKFQDLRKYVPVNLGVNLDDGESTVSMVLNYYHDNSGGSSTNISPILNVIDGFFIESDGTIAYVSATTYDPDGFIVSAVWELVTGAGPDTFVTQGTLTSEGFIDARGWVLPLDVDQFVFRCTVTDNGGAVVSKDVTVSRIQEVELATQYVCGHVLTNQRVPVWFAGQIDPRGTTYAKGVRLDFLTGISTSYNFNVRITAEALLCSVMAMDEPLDVSCDLVYTLDSSKYTMFGGGIKLFKNSQQVGLSIIFYHNPDGSISYSSTSPTYTDFTMNASDVIYVQIHGYQNGTGGTTRYMNTKVIIESIEEINNAVEVSNEGLEFYLTTNYTLQ